MDPLKPMDPLLAPLKPMGSLMSMGPGVIAPAPPLGGHGRVYALTINIHTI